MSLTPATAQALRHALATAVVVPVTPLHADGSPDWDTYAALTGRLIEGGITVITPNGNTGEFYALDGHETRLCLELAVKRAHQHLAGDGVGMQPGIAQPGGAQGLAGLIDQRVQILRGDGAGVYLQQKVRAAGEVEPEVDLRPRHRPRPPARTRGEIGQAQQQAERA